MPPKLQTSRDEFTATLTSGPLTARVSLKPGDYGIDFVSTAQPSKILTSSGYKAQAVIDLPSKWASLSASNASCMATNVSANPIQVAAPQILRYIMTELNLAGGELIYGTGESFGPVVKNGQAISVWNRDGGTSSEQSYKCGNMF